MAGASRSARRPGGAGMIDRSKGPSSIVRPDPESAKKKSATAVDVGMALFLTTLSSRILTRSASEKDHRIDCVERPVLPLAHLVEHGIGDPADQVGRDVDRIDSRRWPWISRTVMPRAYVEMILSSKPSSRALTGR